MEFKFLWVMVLMIPFASFTSGKRLEYATFAGGCFWCMEAPFEQFAGVIKVTAGYTGGKIKNPTYEDVSSGETGHYEAVQIAFDPEQISYEKLLEIFWQQIDPTDEGGQFVDQGTQYRTAIFYHDDQQRKAAQKSKDELDKSGRYKKPVITQILPVGQFYPAEDYHQDYYKKFPDRYRFYKNNSGREQFLEKIWGTKEDRKIKTSNDYLNFQKPGKTELKNQLTKLQCEVTQENATERPFANEYWNNKKEGIYIDIVSGEPLFSSLDKFDSGSGWPSFTKPLESGNIVEKEDHSYQMNRTEVRSKYADSHLGHLFDDGPAPTGLRYCINSAALKFIPKDELEKNGYGEYLKLFDKK